MSINFKDVQKETTERGSTCYTMQIETSHEANVWQKAVYFGNTVPKKVTGVSLHISKDGSKMYYVVEIQPHTSRDKKTGRFTSFKRCHA